MVGFNPIVELQFHGVAHIVLDEDLDGLFDGSGFVSIVDWMHSHPLRSGGVDLVGSAPLGVGLLNVFGVAFVVSLHFVVQAVGDVDVGQVNGDEERTVVVGHIACGALHVAVS